MNRSYPRKFDWDKARARYANGDSITEIARDAGVTWSAVQRVVKPEVWRRMREHSASLKGKGICDRCGGSMNLQSRYRGSKYCVSCAHDLHATTVRDYTLLCVSCHKWKPDNSFPRDKRRPARRGRHRQCTQCNTIYRREYRHRNREKTRAYDRAYKARRRQDNDLDAG